MPIFCGMYQKGQWWFRVLGIGLSWKDTRIHPLMFSERNGYIKGLRVGAWQFYFLPSVPAVHLTKYALDGATGAAKEQARRNEFLRKYFPSIYPPRK